MTSEEILRALADMLTHEDDYSLGDKDGAACRHGAEALALLRLLPELSLEVAREDVEQRIRSLLAEAGYA